MHLLLVDALLEGVLLFLQLALDVLYLCFLPGAKLLSNSKLIAEHLHIPLQTLVHRALTL